MTREPAGLHNASRRERGQKKKIKKHAWQKNSFHPSRTSYLIDVFRRVGLQPRIPSHKGNAERKRGDEGESKRRYEKRGEKGIG